MPVHVQAHRSFLFRVGIYTSLAFFTVRNMSYSSGEHDGQQSHGEQTPPRREPRAPAATALSPSEAGYANAATSTHRPTPAPPTSTPNPMWDSGQTAEEEDGEDAIAMTEDQPAESVQSEDDVEWERMEYVRCNRLPPDHLDGWSSDALKNLDDFLRDNNETCRRMNAERRVLDMSKASMPQRNSSCDCRNGMTCEECCEDWCPLCGRYDRCPCDVEEVAVAMEQRSIRLHLQEIYPAARFEMHQNPAAPPRKAPPPPMPKPKKMPTMPKPTQISRCLDRYRCLEPEPNGRITLVEPGDPNYVTDGVPWSVCSRCKVFRPFASRVHESCSNLLGVECTYDESDGEAQQQEPYGPEWEQEMQ